MFSRKKLGLSITGLPVKRQYQATLGQDGTGSFVVGAGNDEHMRSVACVLFCLVGTVAALEMSTSSIQTTVHAWKALLVPLVAYVVVASSARLALPHSTLVYVRTRTATIPHSKRPPRGKDDWAVVTKLRAFFSMALFQAVAQVGVAAIVIAFHRETSFDSLAWHTPFTALCLLLCIAYFIAVVAGGFAWGVDSEGATDEEIIMKSEAITGQQQQPSDVHID